MNKDYVVITGAYGGLGEAMAYRFAQAGFGIVLLGRSPEKLKALETDLQKHTDVLSVTCDVSDWDSCVKAHGLIEASNLSVQIADSISKGESIPGLFVKWRESVPVYGAKMYHI